MINCTFRPPLMVLSASRDLNTLQVVLNILVWTTLSSSKPICMLCLVNNHTCFYWSENSSAGAPSDLSPLLRHVFSLHLKQASWLFFLVSPVPTLVSPSPSVSYSTNSHKTTYTHIYVFHTPYHKIKPVCPLIGLVVLSTSDILKPHSTKHSQLWTMCTHRVRFR